MNIHGKFTFKYWKSKKDYNKGNAIIKGKNYDIRKAFLLTMMLIDFNCYACEIFDTDTGETIFHSINGPFECYELYN